MWQPAWGIRTALLGVQAFMGARAEAAVGIGSLDYPPEERSKLARKSRDWKCPICDKTNVEILPEPKAEMGDARRVEALPEGLTIDTSARPKPDERDQEEGSSAPKAMADTNVNGTTEKDTRAFQQQQQQPPQQPDRKSLLGSTFGSQGPRAEFLASVVGAQFDESLQASSITSSQVTTPNILTPNRQLDVSGSTPNRSLDASSSAWSSGGGGGSSLRARKPSSHSEMANPSSSSSSSFSSSGQAPTSTATRQVRQSSRTPDRAVGSAPPLQRPIPIRPVVLATTVEPERTLATLDRAIVTVILLLIALVVRRILHSFGY